MRPPTRYSDRAALFGSDQQRVSKNRGEYIFNVLDELLVVKFWRKFEIIGEEQLGGDLSQLLLCKGLSYTSKGS